MTKGNFYFLSDKYYEKFKKYNVMTNKDTVDGIEHKRPCYYVFPDEENEDLYWMVPISSQTDKYEEILEKKLEKYDDYLGLEFGYVRGRYAAFLLQNLCPVTKEYIVEEYIDMLSGNPVSIPNDLKRTLNKKARKIIRLTKNGIRCTLTDINGILAEL